MKKAKHYLSFLTFLWVLVISALFSSCTKDENKTPTFADPTIAVSPANPEQSPGNTVDFTIAVAAEAGLASVTLGDTNIKTYDSDVNSDAIVYTYTVDAAAAMGPLTLTFTVTDKQTTAKTKTASVTLTVTATPQQTIEVKDSISGDVTWEAANKYILKGNVYVVNGAELTIEAGTIIFGEKATKGALIVSRGGKIHAIGTESNPIVFTSAAPVGFRNYGDWGGIVILGRAVNNQSENKTIEGISAATGDNGLYGGSSNDDNSGEFQYCRIEFAGIALSTDNELNGLTMGSVGSGTTIDHVQVSYSGDDSFEWFGGKVNTSYLVAFRGWDDEFDTDFGYSGTNQFLVSYRDPNQADKSGSNGFESDNNAEGDDKTPLTSATFANVSFFGPYVFAALKSGALNPSNVNNNFQHGAHIRRNSALQVYNCAFIGSSKLDGVIFDKSNAAAVFEGNYFGRLTTMAVTEIQKTIDPFDTLGFFIMNIVENPLSTLDLSTKFAGLDVVADLTNPPALLATGSVLLTAGVDLPDNSALVDQTVTYVGAFDDADNWTDGWTNFDPNNTEY